MKSAKNNINKMIKRYQSLLQEIKYTEYDLYLSSIKEILEEAKNNGIEAKDIIIKDIYGTDSAYHIIRTVLVEGKSLIPVLDLVKEYGIDPDYLFEKSTDKDRIIGLFQRAAVNGIKALEQFFSDIEIAKEKYKLLRINELFYDNAEEIISGYLRYEERKEEILNCFTKELGKRSISVFRMFVGQKEKFEVILAKIKQNEKNVIKFSLKIANDDKFIKDVLQAIFAEVSKANHYTLDSEIVITLMEYSIRNQMLDQLFKIINPESLLRDIIKSSKQTDLLISIIEKSKDSEKEIEQFFKSWNIKELFPYNVLYIKNLLKIFKSLNSDHILLDYISIDSKTILRNIINNAIENANNKAEVFKLKELLKDLAKINIPYKEIFSENNFDIVTNALTHHNYQILQVLLDHMQGYGITLETIIPENPLIISNIFSYYNQINLSRKDLHSQIKAIFDIALKHNLLTEALKYGEDQGYKSLAKFINKKADDSLLDFIITQIKRSGLKFQYLDKYIIADHSDHHYKINAMFGYQIYLELPLYKQSLGENNIGSLYQIFCTSHYSVYDNDSPFDKKFKASYVSKSYIIILLAQNFEISDPTAFVEAEKLSKVCIDIFGLNSKKENKASLKGLSEQLQSKIIEYIIGPVKAGGSVKVLKYITAKPFFLDPKFLEQLGQYRETGEVGDTLAWHRDNGHITLRDYQPQTNNRLILSFENEAALIRTRSLTNELATQIATGEKSDEEELSLNLLNNIPAILSINPHQVVESAQEPETIYQNQTISERLNVGSQITENDNYIRGIIEDLLDRIIFNQHHSSEL